MSDFSRKTKELNKSTTLQSAYVPEADPFLKVSTLAGDRLTLPAHQIPKSSPYENANIYRYSASGNYTGILTTGGGVQVFLTRGSGSGPMLNWPCLRMQVYNASASVPVSVLPAALWLQNVQYYTPSGAPVGVQDGQGLWNNIIEQLDSDEYYEYQRAMRADNAYHSGDPILPLETANIYVPLIGNPLSPGRFFIPACNGDFQVLFNFLPSTSWILSGGALTLSNLTIDTMQSQLSEVSLSSLISQYKMGRHDFWFPYERVQLLTQAWTAGSTYQIPLSGIAGDVSFIRMGLYSSAVGNDLANPVPIASFQFQNNAGEPISGMNYIEGEFNRLIMQPKYFKGRASRRVQKYVYLWTKNQKGCQELIEGGTKYGSYPFTNKESLFLVMAGAGTNEVITLTPNVAPTGGSFQIQFTNPDIGTCVTEQIAYNATAATIEAAIEGLLNFTGNCTVTGTMATAVVITFNGGGFQNRPLNADGYCLSVVNAMTAASAVVVSNVLTTDGVAGITSGNTYTLKLWAYTSSIGHQLTDGSVEAQNSG